ncbi:MAG: LCP family protein [Propionibacteriaceae bacterium]|nr:LCP family protein [Propionibacteriaceae bacterium]
MAQSAVLRRSRRAQTRRAGLFFLVTLLIPGSAQLSYGRRGFGRLSVGLWILAVIGALAAAVAFLTARNQLIELLASAWFLFALAALIGFTALVWLLALAGTWALARPFQLGAGRGLAYTLLAIVLALALSVGAWTATKALVVSGVSLTRILTGGGNTQHNNGRYNILLLGSDSGPDREGTRPDAIMLASVDAETGRTVLFSLPRNLENVPFALSSPLAQVYPSGFDCQEEACMLNAVYLAGLEHADLYPGVADPGVQAMADAVSGVTGLAVNYYVMVNMAGFSSIIDAVGGIELSVGRPVAVGAEGVVYYTIEPGRHHFTGDEALWFARTRVDSDDFDRMARQKCVVAAMVAQFNPGTVVNHFTELAQLSGNILVTDIPSRAFGELGSLALKTRVLPITSVSFTPPLISTGNPDFAFIRQLTQDEIARSEALDEPASTAGASEPGGGAGVSVDPGATDPDEAAGNSDEDLQAVCSV